MKNPFKQAYWSPYIVGFLLAMVLVFAFFVVGRGVGAATVFASASCLLASFGNHVKTLYCTVEFAPRPLIDFHLMIIFGIILGAYVSAKLSGTYKVVSVPELWQKRFGSSVTKRYWGAFLGGLLIMFGVPLSAGCTLSRGIFVSSTLEASGWLFLGATFCSAAVMAYALYGCKSEG